MVRVLVTRPEPGASSSARALREAGHEPLLLPLTETRPAPSVPTLSPGPRDAVAITSANAVRHAPRTLLDAVADLPCYAVGAATAEAARRAGLIEVTTGEGDAASLADLLAAKLRPGAGILYLCGRVRRPEFELNLRDRGLQPMAIETYDTVPLELDRARVRTVTAGRIGAVTVHSREATRALVRLIALPGIAEVFRDAILIAISARAAAPAEALFSGRMLVAREPTDAAMVDELAGLG